MRARAVALSLALASLPAWAEPVVIWPAGWTAEAPAEPAGAASHRQRGVKYDAQGQPLLVLEVTQSTIDHQPDTQAVLMEMRKQVQKQFAGGGFQSACTHPKLAQVAGLSGHESTCQVTQNGNHVLSQRLVVVAGGGQAVSVSVAGNAEAYKAQAAEIEGVVEGISLVP